MSKDEPTNEFKSNEEPTGETISNEEPTNEIKGPNGEPFTRDPQLKEWYKEGFLFAINYLHAIFPEESEDQLNKKGFKNFVESNLMDVELRDDFFENRTIATADENYPEGVCPGPGGMCVPCPSAAIAPISIVDES